MYCVLTCVCGMKWGIEARAESQLEDNDLYHRLRRSVNIRGVYQQLTLVLPIESRDFEVNQIFDQRLLRVDVQANTERIKSMLPSLPEMFHVKVRNLADGTRIEILSKDGRILSENSLQSMNGQLYLVVGLGIESEESELRNLAELLSRPIPVPQNLGAHLELWHDAERLTANFDLHVARRMWEKLKEVHEVRDLASFRLAEIFIMSGHINEALARLREVSRSYPRSTGAALARITALNLESIIEPTPPSAEQIVIAASSGNRPQYTEFAWLRAARALMRVGAGELALHYFPREEQFNGKWRERAQQDKERLLGYFMGEILSQNDAVELVTHFLTWRKSIEEHPDLDSIESFVADAMLEVGMSEQAIEILRFRLNRISNKNMRSNNEALVVEKIVEAYGNVGQMEHAQASLLFLLKKYPQVSSLEDLVRVFLIRKNQTFGLRAMQESAMLMFDAASDVRAKRKVLGVDLDLLEAWGENEQLVQVGQKLIGYGFDDPNRRYPVHAIALHHVGQFSESEKLLREWIPRESDANLRDKMKYYLAKNLQALGQNDACEKILLEVAKESTVWGIVARSVLKEKRVETLIKAYKDRRQQESAYESVSRR